MTPAEMTILETVFAAGRFDLSALDEATHDAVNDLCKSKHLVVVDRLGSVVEVTSAGARVPMDALRGKLTAALTAYDADYISSDVTTDGRSVAVTTGEAGRLLSVAVAEALR